MALTLVFGHRNPDNDSVCSAVAYAHLKNVTDAEDVYVAGRLGPMPPESVWVFERFGVEQPDELEHVRLRARDVMTSDVLTADPDDALLSVGRLLQEHGVRSVPVVRDGRVGGLVTGQMLAARYVEDFAMTGFSSREVTAGRLASVLGGRLVTGDPDLKLGGDVLIGAMEPETMRTYIKEGDTLIVGDRLRTQPMALEAGVACLVLTGDAEPEPAVLEAAGERGAAIVQTGSNTYGAARLINLSDRVGDVMETEVVRVGPDDLLTEVAEDLFASPHREAVVEDSDGRMIGLITRTSIARAEPRRVILVDHNEVSQSAPGIEEASVVEIVDHHRVGDVQTAGPVLFLNLPVGSSATIVAERYRDAGVDLPDAMAGILLSAVLSDTLLLKSPTATDVDRDVADRLASGLGVDVTDFGMAMFKARSTGVVFSAERAVTADLKEYRLGDASVAVGQVETVDAAEVLVHRSEMESVMGSLRESRGYDLVLLMVTDVVREGSHLLAAGRVRLAERAFDTAFEDGSAWLPGVLSRKKQVASSLAAASR